MLPNFAFDQRVAVETILYIVSRTKDPTFHHISKILYFADLFHLERYGRFICGDSYIAMKYGPVPSSTYDMLKAQRGEMAAQRVASNEAAFNLINNFTVEAQRPPNMEWLSDSDIECLDESLGTYDHLDFWTLTNESHDQAWKSAPTNGLISLDAIVERIGNPVGLLEYLQDPNP